MIIFFVWDCVFDIKSISWHIDVIVLQIFKHRTWQFAAKGGEGVEAHQKMMNWIKMLIIYLITPHNFSFGWQGILASKAHGYMATAPGGRMLNTPHPPVPRPLNFADVSQCGTLCIAAPAWFWKELLISMFSMLPDHGCGRTEPNHAGATEGGALHWHPPSS